MQKKRYMPQTLKPSQNKEVVKMLSAAEANRIRDKIIETSIQTIIAAVIITLHDSYGFSIKKINNFLKKNTQKMQDVKDGLVSISDFVEWCKEKGIEGL